MNFQVKFLTKSFVTNVTLKSFLLFHYLYSFSDAIKSPEKLCKYRLKDAQDDSISFDTNFFNGATGVKWTRNNLWNNLELKTFKNSLTLVYEIS